MVLGCVPVKSAINRRGITMMTHDQMAFAVSKLYPDLACWKDYWVAHPVESGSDKQIGSDWTQLMDVPEQTRTQWAVYRQLLRDLPQQKDFPSQIVWPKPPTY